MSTKQYVTHTPCVRVSDTVAAIDTEYVFIMAQQKQKNCVKLAAGKIENANGIDERQHAHAQPASTPPPSPPCTLLSALINGRLLQDTVAGRVLTGQATNIKCRIEPGPPLPLPHTLFLERRRKCRKVSNHCECDATRAKHAIYLLPINVQATTTTTTTEGSGHNIPVCVCVCVLGNRSKPQDEQIGRFIKRVSA